MGEAYPMRSCGFVVFRREDGEVRFLLLRSARDGYWGFPKGHILPGENPLEAAMRELREEADCEGFSVMHGFHVTINYHVFKEQVQWPKQVDYFLCEAKGSNVRLSGEHLDYRWATLEEARELLQFENLKCVIKKAYEFVPSTPEAI